VVACCRELAINEGESCTTVDSDEVSYIFEQKAARLMGVQNSRHLEEESAAKVGKAVALPGPRKTLAWKSGGEKVVRRNRRCRNVSNVAVRSLTKVVGVGRLCFDVDFGRKRALSTKGIDCHPKAADPCEKFNISKSACLRP
jgi:hypothetical protein